jgi:hypothetical protein
LILFSCKQIDYNCVQTVYKMFNPEVQDSYLESPIANTISSYSPFPALKSHLDHGSPNTLQSWHSLFQSKARAVGGNLAHNIVLQD